MQNTLAPLLWFAAVVVAIPLSLWLLKRSPWGARLGAGSAGPQAASRVVGAMAIGPGQRLVTVEVGQGASRVWLVLGVTPQQITTLHTLPAAAEAPAADTADAMPAGFAAVLRQFGHAASGGRARGNMGGGGGDGTGGGTGKGPRPGI